MPFLDTCHDIHAIENFPKNWTKFSENSTEFNYINFPKVEFWLKKWNCRFCPKLLTTFFQVWDFGLDFLTHSTSGTWGYTWKLSTRAKKYWSTSWSIVRTVTLKSNGTALNHTSDTFTNCPKMRQEQSSTLCNSISSKYTVIHRIVFPTFKQL